MSTFPFDIVGFDLDGTLADTVRDLAPAIDHALSLEGRDPIPPDGTRKLIGGGSQLMLRRALDLTGGQVADERFDTLYDAFLGHYADHIADNTVLYPGCLDALDALAGRGCKLAVVTNKPQKTTDLLLDQLGITERFASVLGGDALGPGRSKPAPDMIEETIARCGGGSFAMVGDSSFDVRAAHAADAPCVILSYGYHAAPPGELDADAVIDHYDSLVAALEGLGSD